VLPAQVLAAEAALAAQAAQLRAAVQAAAHGAEEQCRRTEAAAGVRLARMTVRLQELARQVGDCACTPQRHAIVPMLAQHGTGAGRSVRHGLSDCEPGWFQNLLVARVSWRVVTGTPDSLGTHAQE
jgi:hypothetical protein